MHTVSFPLDVEGILRERKSLRRQLRAHQGLGNIRVAILGGTTTSEVLVNLEILLLSRGIRPEFYESEYNRYYEDAVIDSAALEEFRPDVVYICTSSRNLRYSPDLLATEKEVEQAVEAEMGRFRQIWAAIEQRLPKSTIIQNNCEPCTTRPLGNLDATARYGASQFIDRVNAAMASEARSNPHLLIADAHGIASRLGTRQWFSPEYWFHYKMAQTPEAAVYLANTVSAMIATLYGRSKKCLVLDLDNTLWGGVIGDDGVERIQIGKETAVGEAYTAFQQYCKQLQQRGVLLAVCSKNEESNARLGFTHPDSVLGISDFAAFYANWQPKHENIEAIARELNIGIDSLVFVDDNPAERALVRGQLPMVAVPEVGGDVSRFAEILEESGYFEAVAVSTEDIERTRMYSENASRVEMQRQFSDYGDYLLSLEMEAEIGEFSPVYLDRIAQLTNKSNQFNLTTKRYTSADLASFASRPDCVTLYGRLRDKFGDNGLVTVLLGFLHGNALDIDLWLMSCRVLKRDMELAMLDAMVARAKVLGASRLIGRYLKTAKNGMVADHYAKLGFTRVAEAQDGSSSTWELLIGDYAPRNRYIKEIGNERRADLTAVAANLS